MKPPALIAGTLLVIVYILATILYWIEAAQPKHNLCPLCGEEAQP
jgi:hypothetical protein